MSLTPKVGVGIWVIKDHKLLLGQRKGSHGDRAWSPPGGHLEFGEDPLETVQRELFEETSLMAKKIEPLTWTNDLYPEDNKHYISLHYLVADFSGELKVMEPNKCLDWKWFDLGKYPTPLFASAQNLLNQIVWENYLKKTIVF